MFVTRELGSADHDALLALSQSSNTGSARFVVRRAPNFFALSRELGDARYYGVFADAELIGCAAITLQWRYLQGQPQQLHYLHDLRVHPRWAGSRALFRLASNLREVLEPKSSWCFATILDENQRAQSLIERGRGLPKVRKLAKTQHIGVPLFLPRPRAPRMVELLDAQTAWQHYQRLAARHDFAPADRERFLASPAPGYLGYLGYRSRGRTLAVCKLLDQSSSRGIERSGALTRAERWLNTWCRAVRAAPLPAPGELLRFVYLSHCVAETEALARAVREAFVAFLRATARSAHSYVFWGEPASAGRRPSPFELALSSTTYAFADAPPDLRFDFHELSWI